MLRFDATASTLNPKPKPFSTVYRDYIGNMYRDNGNENGNYRDYRDYMGNRYIGINSVCMKMALNASR